MIRLIQYVYLMCLSYKLVASNSYFSQEADDNKNSKINTGIALILKSESIKNKIENPSGYGKDLTKELYFFYEELQVLLKAIEETNFALTDAQLVTLKALVKEGGPSYLKAKVSNGLLIGKYGWTSIELNDFVEMINDSRSVWQKIDKTARTKNIV
uniref:Uncharacterized protein n=1 Tax=Clastoptera arizonana TaxID=38151 RepID=A0A1B6E2M0_9HEMI